MPNKVTSVEEKDSSMPTNVQMGKKKSSEKFLSIALTIMLVLITGLAGYLYLQNDAANTEINNLKAQLDRSNSDEDSSDSEADDSEDSDTESSDEEGTNVVNKYEAVTISELGIKMEAPASWTYLDGEGGPNGEGEGEYVFQKITAGLVGNEIARLSFLSIDDSSGLASTHSKLATNYDESWDRLVWQVGDEYIYGYYTSLDGAAINDISCDTINTYICETGVLTRILLYVRDYMIEVTYTGNYEFLENTENITKADLIPFDNLYEIQEILKSIETI